MPRRCLDRCLDSELARIGELAHLSVRACAGFVFQAMQTRNQIANTIAYHIPEESEKLGCHEAGSLCLCFRHVEFWGAREMVRGEGEDHACGCAGGRR